VKEIANEGMPIHKRPFDKGVLVVKFSIKFPESISPDNYPVSSLPPPNKYFSLLYTKKRTHCVFSIQVLAKVLPEPAPLEALNMDNVEEVTLQDYGTAQSANPARGRQKEVYEEEESGHPQGMGCSQQ